MHFACRASSSTCWTGTWRRTNRTDWCACSRITCGLCSSSKHWSASFRNTLTLPGCTPSRRQTTARPRAPCSNLPKCKANGCRGKRRCFHYPSWRRLLLTSQISESKKKLKHIWIYATIKRLYLKISLSTWAWTWTTWQCSAKVIWLRLDSRETGNLESNF